MKYTFIISLLSLYILNVNAQQACNGHAELCEMPYNQVTYVTTHNSYGFVPNPAANQLCPVNTQLDDGVRGLKLSAIKLSNATTLDSGIQLCHTSCNILNAGPAATTLTEINEWLKKNPNEVVTIIWNNLGGFDINAFKEAYTTSGLIEYNHIQPVGSRQWPTLGEMISSGKRLINFVDEGADQSVLPWMMSQFDYVFETPYNNRNEESFNCVIDRPTEPYNSEEMMYVMNHFLYGTLNFGTTVIDIPQKGTANVTNADSLLKHAETCTATFGRRPNFLKVDFFNRGRTMQIAATLNNVTYTGSDSLQCDIYAATTVDYDDEKLSIASQNILYMSVFLLSLVATAFVGFL